MGDHYATYATYAAYLNELGALVGGLRIYAPIFGPEHPEHEYYTQAPLDRRYCEVIALPGHHRRTGGPALLENYLRQFALFLRAAPSWGRVLVYSPSAAAGLAVLAMQLRGGTERALYSYVWGDWGELAKHLPQPGLLRSAINPLQRTWILRQERWLVRHSKVTLVAGPRLRERYESVGRRVVETIPMIDMRALAQPRDARARVPGRILYVGRIIHGKGLELLLRSLVTLRAELPQVHLRIVGGGDSVYVAELREQAAQLGVAQSVEFLGVVANGPSLWEEYAQASAFALPSLSEGFPRVLYEAMALGAPVIATSVGSIARVLQPGIHGVIVPPGDEAALTRGLRELLATPARGAVLGHAARTLFLAKFAGPGRRTKAQQLAEFVLDDTGP